MNDIQKKSAEILYKDEIDFLIKNDKFEKPVGWKMSPKYVLNYIMGGNIDGKVIIPKYIGDSSIVEIAISTLLTDRALLLVGEPGTAKSWLAENLVAAINGDSTRVIQGTSGTTEEQIRYSWNYAMLIAEGPSENSLIKSHICDSMEKGQIARIEEISRCATEVQDSLLSLLSEKRISIPELNSEVVASKGFALIATANTRDKGVNEMSVALKRRFNTIVLPTPSSLDEELSIVNFRLIELAKELSFNYKLPSDEIITTLCTIFRELRTGYSIDGQIKIRQSKNLLSTAEAISVLINSMALASSFGNGEVTYKELSSSMLGAIIKDNDEDEKVWNDYVINIMKQRKSMEELFSVYNAKK